ncbi:MAG: hypothetical protein K0Q53_8 [Massilibacillus sp.]|nr:hypothetical protein [Massilibacillus sp.]
MIKEAASLKKKKRSKNFHKIFAIYVCSFCILQSNVEATNAISVADEVKNTAGFMRESAKKIAEHRKAVAKEKQAEADVSKTAKDVAQLEADKAVTEKTLAAAVEVLKKNDETAKQAELEAKEKDRLAKQAMADEEVALQEKAIAEQAIAEAKAEENEITYRENAAVQAAEAQADVDSEAGAAEAVKAVGYDETRIDEAKAQAQAIATRAYAAAEERSLVAEARVNEAAAAVEAAEKRLEETEGELGFAADARLDADEAEKSAQEAKKDLMGAKSDVEKLRISLAESEKELTVAQAVLIEAQVALENAKKDLRPITNSRTTQTEAKYYSWKDSQGYSGHQFYQPYDFNVVDKNTEYGLSTGYVVSNNNLNSNGKISTLTDTTVNIAKTNPKEKYSVRYSLDINLPTGKSKLNGSGQIMSDDLVEKTRFGEGWDYTPGISVSHKIGEEDTWTFDTTYSFRGSYEYDSTKLGAKIDPGSEWSKSLNWLHAGQKWQLFGELSHTNYGRSEENGIQYREGNQFDAKLFYNFVLDAKQDLMVYYWYSTGRSTTYPMQSLYDAEGDLNRRYFGAEWAKKLSTTRTFHVMANVMNSTGSTYDPIAALYVSDRTKYSGGIGYDVALSPNQTVSFEIEKFYMKDHSPDNSYHGCNLYLRYSANF